MRNIKLQNYKLLATLGLVITLLPISGCISAIKISESPELSQTTGYSVDEAIYSMEDLLVKANKKLDYRLVPDQRDILMGDVISVINSHSSINESSLDNFIFMISTDIKINKTISYYYLNVADNQNTYNAVDEPICLIESHINGEDNDELILKLKTLMIENPEFSDGDKNTSWLMLYSYILATDSYKENKELNDELDNYYKSMKNHFKSKRLLLKTIAT